MDNDQHNNNNDVRLNQVLTPVVASDSMRTLYSTHESIAHHGIAFEVFDRGIVIIGKSGIGKSELGLELIDRGHRLICDDLVAGAKVDDQIIITPPQEFGIGFMEIRGIGFIDLPRFYGAHNLSQAQELFIVIQLVDNETLDFINHDRLRQLISEVNILGIKYPLYKLPIGANRNLPILVELIVKYAIERSFGYDSHQAFIEQQSNHILQGS